MRPLVQCCLEIATDTGDTAYRMVGYAETSYEENGSLDMDFSIPETKDLVGLAVVPMNSRGSDMVF